MKQVIQEKGSRPIKIWTDEIEASALTQLKNLSRLPFINSNGVACMPDVHAGIGSTVGTVIATEKAVIPAAVGVDIGCGMNAVRTSLTAAMLPDAPDLFSTMTGCPHLFCRCSATRRAMPSAAPPGGTGTINRIALLG